MLRHHQEIERITGYKPNSCPWDAVNDEVVREVLKYRSFYDPPNLAAAWGDDPLDILVEGMGVYSRAVNAVFSEDRMLEEAKRKAKSKS